MHFITTTPGIVKILILFIYQVAKLWSNLPNHLKQEVVLFRNKVGGSNKKYQGQILVGIKGLQWHKAALEMKVAGSNDPGPGF